MTTQRPVVCSFVFSIMLMAGLAASACARGEAPGTRGDGPAPVQGGGAARASGVDGTLAAARAGYGSQLSVLGQGVQLTGTSSFLGTEQTVSALISATGDVLMEVRGKVGMTRCMTGDKAWAKDIGGEVRWLHLGERDEVVLQSLFLTGRWADDPRLTFASGETSDSLRFTLADSPVTGTITLDKTTHRLSRAEYSAGGDASVVTCSDTLEWNGVRLPKTVELKSSNGDTSSLRFSAAEAAPTFIRSPYQPVVGYSDVVFDSSKPASLELKRARTGHLLCRPTINGKQFDWFFFDTGAGGAILTPEVIDELKLERFGAVPVSGIGGKLSSSFVRADTIEIGPVTMKDALATELDLTFVANAIGEKVSGIIGFNLLSRCIAEIDQKGGAISLYDPSVYRGTDVAGALTWVNLVTYERHPCVEATFEDHSGWFKLDTGAAGSTVAIHAPAVTRLGLLDGRAVTDTRVGGVGGVRTAKQGRLKWFELGGHRTENVMATFAVESVGALDDQYTLGNIGGDLMSPFVLVLDYQKERIAFRAR